MADPRQDGGTSGMLPAERNRCSFDVNELMAIMKTDKKRELTLNSKKLFVNTPFEKEFARDEDYLSYSDEFAAQLERTAEAVKIVRDNPKFMMAHSKGQVMMNDLFPANGVAAIHFTMFYSFLKSNASPEQKKAWLDGASDAQYLGAYAQTELGHGSNLRGLETTAHYDVDTEEFIIDSPTLTSMKFWPTGMYACTHGVVFANLYLKENGKTKNCGVQGFFMQFRDHEGNLMPGVEVGEIGPKLIAGHTNIGYARFDHVRIPRFNMFQRLYKVTPEGKFIAPPPKVGKIKNIAMMMMRVFNVDWAARDLSRAVTIAVRYSCVRRQGFKDTTISDGFQSGENTILDYSMQKFRLFKALAVSYKLFWNSRFLNDYLQDVQLKVTMGDENAADELPELHATCSGMKSYSTILAHGLIEDCRKACGGQGFLRQSGIADLTASFAEPCTVEGEQVILSLQVARFLIKSVKQVSRGETPLGSVSYLLAEPLDSRSSSKLDLGDPQTLVALLQDRARRKAVKLEAAFAKQISAGKSFDQATNACAIQSYEAAGCHSAFVMTRNFLLAIEKYVTDKNSRDSLFKLFHLGALVILRESFGDWVYILGELAAEEIYERIQRLLESIRPDAVGLVDAFGHTDDSLRSTLGRFDGKVYEAIYAAAKDGPLNKTDKMVGWDKLKTIFDLDFIKKGVGQRWNGPNDGAKSKL